VLRWTDGALPFGTLGRQYFERYGILPGRIFYFPMEPDYDLITSLDPRIVARVADEFRLSPGRRRLLFSGRLLRMKRVDLLIDAFASIVQLRPKWDLILLGDGDLRGALEARVPPEHAQRFRFLGHAPAPATVAALCRACDVLVLPSEQERWALVINEAAAAGMAIVSSEVPGAVADLVVDGVNGRVFPRNDLDALRACLLDVTAEGRTDQLRASSRLILETWRGLADPVQGLRAALSSVRRAREMPAST
jgi:glycosyltransferase involved in cell wall biosynthesis